MKYIDFENIFTPFRMGRYILACKVDTRSAMTLYRRNLRLSQELFTVISCFEVSLRNSIDNHYKTELGSNWLIEAASTGGIFDNNNCRLTQSNVQDAIRSLGSSCTHNKLVAELGFGFWRYMFSKHQFKAGKQTLLHIFPNKPLSTAINQYNSNFMFGELAKINGLRNRIAHHEPVCFKPSTQIIETSYARDHYSLIKMLFQWMDIDENKLLYGLDHIELVCSDIDELDRKIQTGKN